MEDDLEGVALNIRACIISSKGPVPLRNLMRDYETLVGSPIPFRNLNHPTLESLLHSLPSLRVTGSGRDTLIEAAKDSASSHISKLIAKQKTTKKRDFPPARRPPPSFRSQGHAPRDYQPMNTQRQFSVPSRHPPCPPQPSQYRREQPTNIPESIVVKVNGNDKRQVSVGGAFNSKSSSLRKDSRQKNLPPRLQKLHQKTDPSVASVPHDSPSVSGISQSMEENLYLDQPSSSSLDQTFRPSTIISPFGPSQLIAAGRAKQQEALALYENYLLQESPQRENEVHEAAFAAEIPELYNLGSLGRGISGQDDIPGNLNEFSQQLLSFQNSNQAQSPLVPEEPVLPDVPSPDEENIAKNVSLLHQYAIARGWHIPEYTVLSRRPKGAIFPQYGATVMTGGAGLNAKKYSGYPYEDENVNVAKGYAAKQALAELHKEEKVKLDKTLISTDKNIICDRISDIVAGLYNGMFFKKVEDQYIERYKERLPDDWLQTLYSCPTVSVESTVNNIIIVPKDPTVEPLSVQSLPPAPAPPALETPLGDTWDVFVTYATSVYSVWFRLIGEEYSEKYEELLTDMDDYYKTYSSKELALIEENQYYAAQSEEGWLRVCVCEVKEESKTVTVWLIDTGDNDTFPFSSVYRLAPQFCSLPRQAVQCSLAGLEDCSDDCSEVVAENLIGKTLIAQINYKDKETGCIKATLYDTSGDDDVNVNDKIRDIITCRTGDPVLPNEGGAMIVYVTSVSKKGEVYIQIPSLSQGQIMGVIDNLGSEEISKHKLTSFRQVVVGKIYLAKYSLDNCWYRAVVTATPSVQQNKIAVQFVDFGNTQTVSISDMAEVENLPPIISKLPYQAVKVALHNLPTLCNMEVEMLRSLLTDEAKVFLLKTISLQQDPPVVEIFSKDDGDDSALESVNSVLEMQRKLYRVEENKPNSDDPSSNNQGLNTYTNGLADTSRFNLQRPELDEDFMPVLVRLAAHPGNFFFHPLKYAKDLDVLMDQIQEHYEATTMPELAKEEIVKGGLYAACYERRWYRVAVTEAIVGSKVPTRLCDYGQMVFVSISSLRELEPQFREKPFMAVKGKLAGVIPNHTDWTPEDCVRFQSLVNNKTLASVVKNVEDNFINPMEMIVSLQLIDTSSEDDLDIAVRLINDGRAVKEK